MKHYIFIDSKDKVQETIKLLYIEEDTTYHKNIGDIYNLIEYINNNIKERAQITLLNFTINRLNFITMMIAKYKNIEKVNEYNNMIINNKKRIRGR